MSQPFKTYDRQNYDIDQLDPHWADAQMAGMIGSGKKVLEIGCATGYVGKYLKEKRQCRVSGVELNPDAAAMARQHYEKVVIGDAAALQIYDQFSEKFDVILCSNVLEHLTDPAATLARLKKLLAPDGYFVIALPNIAHWSIRLKLLFGNFNYTEGGGILDNTHLKFFTLKTAEQLLKNAGLKIERWSFDWDNGIPKFNGLLLRVPAVGPAVLKCFYSLRPSLFGFQFIFKAKPV